MADPDPLMVRQQPDAVEHDADAGAHRALRACGTARVISLE
ncbi:hypothetical protein [Pseudonocardia hydrocarbonoxydans]|nr:hypothetical protein [Pseudonocardia hydrocarbonoxydans]